MGFFRRSVAGPGYVILNIIRVLNILSFLAVIAASSVMLVKTFVVSKFFFFDAVGHVGTASLSVFLIVSELPIFRGYFQRNWPLIGQDAGFVTLGVTMVILGVSTLGNLNKEATSQESLGLAFWRIVISAGIVVLVIGVVNIFASYIFRDRRLGVTARHVRTYGAVAPQKVVTRSSSHKSFILGRKDSCREETLSRADTLPIYHSRSSSVRSGSVRHAQRPSPSPTPTPTLKISSPISENPAQFAKFSTSPQIAVPNLAHHPAMYSNRV
ncbi:hypothetical protein FQN54_007286 [Arachnomyces sp. PD_36]|nr:hypothetical protein FQN54_007286 [Arachnomyces sp. PD_36]